MAKKIKSLVQLSNLYLKLLPILGLGTDIKGRITASDSPVLIDDKKVYLPDLKVLDKSKKAKVIFHPLSEDASLDKPSLMIGLIVKATNLKLNHLIYDILCNASEYTASKDGDTKSKFILSEIPTFTPKELSCIAKIINKSSIINISIDSSNGKKLIVDTIYQEAKTAIVNKSPVSIRGVIVTKGLAQKLIEAIDTLLPTLEGVYILESRYTKVSYLRTLMDLIRMLLNDMANYANALGIEMNSPDKKFFKDLDLYMNTLPAQKYNIGATTKKTAAKKLRVKGNMADDSEIPPWEDIPAKTTAVPAAGTPVARQAIPAAGTPVSVPAAGTPVTVATPVPQTGFRVPKW